MATRLRKPEPRQRWAWLVVALAGVAGLVRPRATPP